jgi:hypothetical protein
LFERSDLILSFEIGGLENLEQFKKNGGEVEKLTCLVAELIVLDTGVEWATTTTKRGKILGVDVENGIKASRGIWKINSLRVFAGGASSARRHRRSKKETFSMKFGEMMFSIGKVGENWIFPPKMGFHLCEASKSMSLADLHLFLREEEESKGQEERGG